MRSRKPMKSWLANLLTAALVITGCLVLSSVFMFDAQAAETDATNYDYDATATPEQLETMPGVYRVTVDMNTETEPKTIGIPSVAKQNLENQATKEMPAIIMGAAVNYELRQGGSIEFTPKEGAELLPPYSYFRWKHGEKKEKNPDGTEKTIKTLTGFDGSYYIVRVNVSNIIADARAKAEAAGETLDGKYLHVRQENNKALLVATGMTDSSYVWADTSQTNNKGGCKAAAYPLANNAEAMFDTSGSDNDKPYLDVILLSSSKNVAGAEQGAETAPVSNVDLSFYVDDTNDYKPWMHALDPNNMPTFPYTITYEGKEYKYDSEQAYNQELTTKFYDDTKATAENSATKYRLMGEDLEIDVAVDVDDVSENANIDPTTGEPKPTERDWMNEKMDFWSMEKAIAHNDYDSHTIIMICEVPVLNGLSISGTADRSVVLDVNSFDIQIANNNTAGKAGLTVGDNAVLRIKDGSNTAGAELAIGNNATMVIEKGGTMIIDETCTAEAEFDAASTVDPATQPDQYLSGEITIKDGGNLTNWGVINIEGTEGKPLDPSQQEQVQRDKQSADILVEAGGILDNYGCISLKGTLHVMGMLNNYAKFTDIIQAYDPDKNRIDYHKGIQVTWKDDVRQEGVKPGELYVGKDINGNIDKDAVLNNYGDIVLCPGTFYLFGTFNNLPHPDPDAKYEGHLYLCNVDEAIVPIVNPTDPAIVEETITLDPPKESYFYHKDGIVNNDGGVIDSARVTLLHNGILGELIPVDQEITNATEAVKTAETKVKEAQTAMDTVLAKDNPTKEEIKTAYDAVVAAQNSLAKAKQHLTNMEKAKANAQITDFDTEVSELHDKVETLEGQVTDLKKQLAEVTVDISNYEAKLAKTSYAYTGKAITPAVTVSGLKADDYTVTYANNKAIGKATVTIEGKAEKKFVGKIVKTFKITKKANTLKVSGKTAAVKVKKLKKKAVALKVTQVIKTAKKGKGKITYTKASGNKKIVINKKTGKVTVKRGLKKGTYKVKVKVKAAGTKIYKAVTKTIIIKIIVK